MTSWAEEILAMAKRLPRQDRLRIAEELQKEAGKSEPPQDISETWRDEIVRRMEAFDRGQLATVDGEEVFRRVQAKYAR